MLDLTVVQERSSSNGQQAEAQGHQSKSDSHHDASTQEEELHLNAAM